jgi:NADH-quinone oxidoreductase subunit N
MTNIDFTMIRAILPEILILALAGVLLVVDLFLKEKDKDNLGWVSAVGLSLIIMVSLFWARPSGDPQLLWGGMIREDWLGFSFKMVFIFGAAITSLFAMQSEKIGRRGEFYILMLISTIGMCFMASSADLVMLYLAIETTSIPLYILAGFLTTDNKSTEAGFKYLLFGAMTSAVMLYGFSLLFGFSGTTNLYTIALRFQLEQLPLTSLVGCLLLVLIGFGFKISSVPLHFWAPDVYEGAPTPVTGFLSTASKAAGFAVLLRFLVAVFPAITLQWAAILTAISVITMTLGNLLALAQKNIKRMLAYSSIAHAGYILIGLVAVSELGITSMVFYLVVYLITNLAAFGVVAAYGRVTGSDDFSAYHGMSRRSPALALAFLVALLSLAGMPPLGGFVAKFFVFAAAVKSNLIGLAVVGVLNSIVGLYYYLTVLKYVYLYRSDNDDQPVPMPSPYKLALGILVIGIILIGTLFAPWVSWATTAAQAMFTPF